METRFVQIHALTSYPGALLNRDDAGFAKRLPFGGVTRTRVSSQCLKRHWRTHKDGVFGLDSLALAHATELSIRSRQTFETHISAPLLRAGHAEASVREVVGALQALVLGKSQKAEASAEKAKGKAKEKEEAAPATLQTAQVTVLGVPEVNYLKEVAEALLKDPSYIGITDAKARAKELEKRFKGELGKNLAGLRLASGLDAALFGRMVTSDILARGDAAVHVAHAFTVHKEASESDYFSAVDDLKQESGDQGSGHINSTELTSGLYYIYVVVDVPLLVSNLEGCPQKEWRGASRDFAGEVVERLIRLIATVSPGAKLGSTAPYSYASAVLVEAGDEQPRTLANAFLKPVAERGDLLANTYSAGAEHLRDLDAMYGSGSKRKLAAVGPAELWGVERAPLPEVAAWARAQILGG